MTTRVRHWPLAMSLLLLLVTALGLGALALRVAHGHLVYALDDTYIQMAIAKNLARAACGA